MKLIRILGLVLLTCIPAFAQTKGVTADSTTGVFVNPSASLIINGNVLQKSNGSGTSLTFPGTLSINSGKTLTSFNTLTLAGTDSSTLNIGTGGTLGTLAFLSSINNSNLATMAANTIKANATGSTATPTDVLAQNIHGLPRMGVDANGSALQASTGTFTGQLGVARDGGVSWWNGSNWTTGMTFITPVNFGNGIGIFGGGSVQNNGTLTFQGGSTASLIFQGTALTNGLFANVFQATTVGPTGNVYIDNPFSVYNLTTNGGALGSNGFASYVIGDRYSGGGGSGGYFALTTNGDQTLPQSSGYEHTLAFAQSYPTVLTLPTHADNVPDISFGFDFAGADSVTPGLHHMMDFISYDTSTVKTTATVTSGNSSMTVTGSTTGLSAISGGRVLGPGVAPGTTWTISGSTVTLSANATITNTSLHSGMGDYYVFSPSVPAWPMTWDLRPFNTSNLRAPPAIGMNASGQMGVGDGSSSTVTYTGSNRFSTPSLGIGGSNLVLGGNLTTSGAFASTFTMTGATSLTLPVAGTLITSSTAGTQTITNSTVNVPAVTINSPNTNASPSLQIQAASSSCFPSIGFADNTGATKLTWYYDVTGAASVINNVNPMYFRNAGDAAIPLLINGDNAIFTGAPTAPTASVGTNTTQIATTAFVKANAVSLHATGTPTIALGAGGSGTGSASSITGSDVSGVISVTAGVGVSASATVATITYHTAYGTAPNAIQLTPANSATALLTGVTMVYVDPTANTTTTFAITSGTTALTAATVYKWQYTVPQQ